MARRTTASSRAGSYPEHLQNCRAFSQLFDVSKRTYALFQLHTNEDLYEQVRSRRLLRTPPCFRLGPSPNSHVHQFCLAATHVLLPWATSRRLQPQPLERGLRTSVF